MRSSALFLLLFASIGGCGKTSAEGQKSEDKEKEPPFTSSYKEGSVDVIAAWSRGTWLGKPYYEVHRFDVVLRNKSAEPRWFVLPKRFASPGNPGPPGPTESTIYWYRPAPRVVMASGVSSGIWALRMAGGATIALHNLRIDSHWSEDPNEIELSVIVAKEITVGGKPLASMVAFDVVSQSTEKPIDAPANVSAIVSKWENAGSSTSEPVVVDIESRAAVTVAFSNERVGP